MKFKIDENLPQEVAEILRADGHDALTVRDQSLQGSPDLTIAAVCRTEGRVLVTLDLDFADIRRFRPADHAGIIVLRMVRQSRPLVVAALTSIIPLLSREPIAGLTWIVDEKRVRIRGD